MVAGRGCNDSALFLFRAQSHDAVRSTADLEGTCALEIFKFQVGFPVCQSGNRVGHVKGRLMDQTFQTALASSMALSVTLASFMFGFPP